jgi:DnaK suppressor protein
MTTIDRTEMRRRLQDRRSELLARYRGELERADDAATAHETDAIDRAEDEWDARVLSAMSNADARELAAVIAAIGRLDSGDYGTCTCCGETIDPARLRTVPYATLCVSCARIAEKHPELFV